MAYGPFLTVLGAAPPATAVRDAALTTDGALGTRRYLTALPAAVRDAQPALQRRLGTVARRASLTAAVCGAEPTCERRLGAATLSTALAAAVGDAVPALLCTFDAIVHAAALPAAVRDAVPACLGTLAALGDLAEAAGFAFGVRAIVAKLAAACAAAAVRLGAKSAVHAGMFQPCVSYHLEAVECILPALVLTLVRRDCGDCVSVGDEAQSHALLLLLLFP